MSNTPPIQYQTPATVNGFNLTRVTPMPGIRANAYEFEHIKTGAKLLHLHANDAENLFTVIFPTPPNDSAGLPHILEHAVLGGSRKFPVKEPFFEMVKMSMATFINAMTATDFTVYPVSSNVKQDFFNLAEVYFDAVFHPQLTEETFRREGHHLALKNNADVSSDLMIKGIVYNEMKGVYSNPESSMYRRSVQALFPDTKYSHDSGGDPVDIPSLTYEDFTRFHRELYHPSNALIFLYGDIPTAESLKFLDDRLSEFSRQARPETYIPKQSRWAAPRADTLPYPIGREEKTDAKTFITLTWIVGDAIEPEDVTDWELLHQVLLGNEAALLKKAIIESHLGTDLSYTGYGSTGHEATFRVSLKGSEADRADAFLKLVTDTLTNIANTGVGLERERVDAAFQQLTYQHLEIQSQYPMGLLWAASGTWIYGRDPLTFLHMADHLEACRKRYESDPTFLPRLIRERLLNNPHRMLMTFVPDQQMQARTDEEELKRLAAQKAKLSADQVAKIARDAAELEAAQSKANSPEALATLPQLRVADLPPKRRQVPTRVERLATGNVLLHNEVFANTVNYLQLDFDLRGLPLELYPYLPRFCDAFRKLGAAGMDYTKIAQRIAAHTGGIGIGDNVTTHASDASLTLRRLRLTVRTIDHEADAALGVVRDLLFELDANDPERLKNTLVQAKTAYRTGFVNNGMNTALTHAARGMSPEGALNEAIHGLPQLPLIESLVDRFDETHVDLIAKIHAIRDFLLNRTRFTASFTGSDAVHGSVCKTLETWAREMRDEPIVDIRPEFKPFANPPREGLAGPMQVAYCTLVMPAPHPSDPRTTSMHVAMRLARHDYVLNEVRLKGNAYGAGCYYSGSNRTMGLYSYRDPRLTKTIEVFRGLRDFVSQSQWSQIDIDRTIIGAAKDYQRPIRPSESTGSALSNYVTGHTEELLQADYEELLSATPAKLKQIVLEQLDANESKAAICVVSSREKLEQANAENPAGALVVEDILKS